MNNKICWNKILILTLFLGLPWISKSEDTATPKPQTSAEALVKIMNNGVFSIGGRPILSHLVAEEKGGILGCGIFGDESTRLTAENSFQLTSEIPSIVEEYRGHHYVYNKDGRPDFCQLEYTIYAKCHGGSLIEYKAQGLSPILSDLSTIAHSKNNENFDAFKFDKKKLNGAYFDNESNISIKNFGYLKTTSIDFEIMNDFMVNFGAKHFEHYWYVWRDYNVDAALKELNKTYKITHGTQRIDFGSVNLKINFLNFLKGGTGMRLEMLQSVDDMAVPLDKNALLLRNTPFVTWVGNFDLVSCSQEGKPVNNTDFKPLHSVSELTTRVDEMSLPEGMTTCMFRAPVMTSMDRTQWNDHVKQIIPTLRNVNLSIDLVSANIVYEAYNGIQFGGGEQTGTKPIPLIGANSADWTLVEKLNSTTEALLEVLKGAVPIITQKEEKERLPAVIRYFSKNRPQIHEFLSAIDSLARNEKVPFLSLLNVLRTLKKTYETLDQALGLVSGGEVKLGELLIEQK